MKKRNKSSIDLSLVIPVFNNSLTLEEQLDSCIKELSKITRNYEIIISDDKSTDETRDILNKYKQKKEVKIFNQKNNLGIAENIKFLYKKAKYQHIVLFSVDGDWFAKDISMLINQAIETNADIVIGKRDLKQYTLERRFISRVYNLMPLVLFGVKTYDTGSIKLIKRNLLTDIPVQLKSVSFEAEFIIKAVKLGYKVTYVPIHFKKNYNNKFSAVNKKLVFDSFVDLLRLRLNFNK